MRRKSLLLVLCGAAAVVSACATEEDSFRERAEGIEKTYGLAPAEARIAAKEHPVLETSAARSLFARLADVLGMKRLAYDDVSGFVALAEKPAADRDAVAAAVEKPELLTFLGNLRATFGYEARIRELDELLKMSERRGEYAAAFQPAVRDAVQVVRQRVPRARFPLVAVDAAKLLAPVPPARLARTLDRFGRLEVDLGVHELDARALALLARTAQDPRQADALASLVRNLPALQPLRIDEKALETVAAIPSASFATMLDHLGPTRTWRSFVGFNEAAAHYLLDLSARPQAAALVALLEDASDTFQCEGSPGEVRRLIRIDAAAPEGQAREALTAAFRARIVVDRLDDGATDLLIALIAKADLRDAVTALHAAFGRWHPTPNELPALQVLAGTAVGPVARSVRTLGYEINERPITLDEATSLAELAKANAQPLIDEIHVILPRLVVKGAAALGELAALAKAGVTKEDIMKLDVDSITGTLDVTKRTRIVEKVKKTG